MSSHYFGLLLLVPYRTEVFAFISRSPNHPSLCFCTNWLMRSSITVSQITLIFNRFYKFVLEATLNNLISVDSNLTVFHLHSQHSTLNSMLFFHRLNKEFPSTSMATLSCIRKNQHLNFFQPALTFALTASQSCLLRRLLSSTIFPLQSRHLMSLIGMWRGVACRNGLQDQWYVVGKFVVFPTAVLEL